MFSFSFDYLLPLFPVLIIMGHQGHQLILNIKGNSMPLFNKIA